MGNKSYRIRTDVGKDKFLHVQLDQDYDVLEILSLKIGQQQFYRLHTSNYGVIVGRVLANGGFGVPNAKVSLFISKNNNDDVISAFLYPYGQVTSTNEDGIRYNLLPSEKVTDCHNPVGTFPSKQYMLDNDSVLEVFEDYYRYTTKTNDAGDYMFVGVPVGSQTLHMDLDLSDCGVLSQRPYDFLYKGYNIEQFENANQFKTSNTLEELSQIFTQDQTVEVKPFWGDSSDDLQDIGITRADINVNFKFETSCVFLGSVFSDDSDNGMSKRCLPRKKMGKMENLKTGEGTIEIIRKRTTYTENESSVEEFQIKGTQLIDGDGTWCFQIPMNLDYMITDEYGNLVPTDNPEKGIATRTRVRFRISMNSDNSAAKYFQAKVLVPNNPKTFEDYQTTYVFGSNTQDKDFKDLFWNNVYSVKSYIPRLQHANLLNNRSKRFTGIKTVNKPGSNNPFPYNHIRIQFPFYYTLICWLVKTVNAVVYVFNWFKTIWNHFLQQIYNIAIGKWHLFGFVKPLMFKSYTKVSGSFCPELSDRYFIPGAPTKNDKLHGGHEEVIDLYGNTFRDILRDEYPNLTGVTSQDVNQSIMYPLQSGNTLYGYYKVDYSFNKGTLISNNTIYFIGYYASSPSYTLYWGINVNNLPSDGFIYYANSSAEIKTAYPKNLATKQITSAQFNEDFINGLSYKIYYSSGLDGFKKAKFLNPGGEKVDMGYDDFIRIMGNIIDNINGEIESVYNGDKNSIEAQANTQTNLNEDEPQICLYPETDYLVSCIEYNLADELDIINFDFYNDWINGAIYMPRWKRLVRINRINGKTAYRSCSTDARTSFGTPGRNTLNITEVGPTIYNANGLTVENKANNGHFTWKERAISNGMGDAIVHAEKYAIDETTKVYYYIPASVSKDEDTIKGLLYATDIILLGSLKECNIYGIPSDFSIYPSTSYQLPPDLATTNLVGDDGSGISLSSDGCVKAKNIQSSKNEDLWNQYTGSSETSLVSNVTGDYIPATEESGIMWNKLGPNQGSENTDAFSPGGHFLGLACMEETTQTTLKTNVNLMRACEIGVSLSQRQVVTHYYDEGEYKDIYVVPNGLINKNDIYDHYGRSLFATLNSCELDTIVDENTGYLKYKMEYLHPYSFNGELNKFISSNNDIYNRSIKVDIAAGLELGSLSDETRKEIDWEQKHTYLRANDEKSNDYSRFRYGLSNYDTGRFIGNKIYKNGESTLTSLLLGGGFAWLLQLATNKTTSEKYMPLYNNSFYFYFGLMTNHTAIDEFRKQYEAICAKKETINYRGQLTTEKDYLNQCGNEIIAYFKIDDADGPYNISINNATNRYGIYVLKNGAIINGNDDFENVFDKLNYVGDEIDYYTEKGFYVLADNDLVNTVTVITKDNFLLQNTVGNGSFEFSDFNYEIIPFTQWDDEVTNVLDDTPQVINGLITNRIGGYIIVDLPLDEMIEGDEAPYNKNWRIKIEDVDDDSNIVTYGCNEAENNKYIKKVNEYYQLPIPRPGIYNVYIIREDCEGEDDTTLVLGEISVPLNEDSEQIYLLPKDGNDDEALLLNNNIETNRDNWGKFHITSENREFVANNLTQYDNDDNFKPISLVTSINNEDTNVLFIGQGEIFTPGKKELDTTGKLKSTDAYFNEYGYIYPSTVPSMVGETFSLNNKQLYIPTKNYEVSQTVDGKVTNIARNKFNIVHYDNYKIYGIPKDKITGCTVAYLGPEHSMNYNLKDGEQRILIKFDKVDWVTGINTTYILRGGDIETGELRVITPVIQMESNLSANKFFEFVTTSLGDKTFNFIDGRIEYVIFKAYELPIYYINQSFQTEPIVFTLSNVYKKGYYNPNDFVQYTVSNWFPYKFKLGGKYAFQIDGKQAYIEQSGETVNIIDVDARNILKDTFYDMGELQANETYSFDVKCGEEISQNYINDKTGYSGNSFTLNLFGGDTYQLNGGQIRFTITKSTSGKEVDKFLSIDLTPKLNPMQYDDNIFHRIDNIYVTAKKNDEYTNTYVDVTFFKRKVNLFIQKKDIDSAIEAGKKIVLNLNIKRTPIDDDEYNIQFLNGDSAGYGKRLRETFFPDEPSYMNVDNWISTCVWDSNISEEPQITLSHRFNPDDKNTNTSINKKGEEFVHYIFWVILPSWSLGYYNGEDTVSYNNLSNLFLEENTMIKVKVNDKEFKTEWYDDNEKKLLDFTHEERFEEFINENQIEFVNTIGIPFK